MIGPLNSIRINVKWSVSPKKKNPVIYPNKLPNIELKTLEMQNISELPLAMHDFNWKTHIEYFIKRNIQTYNQKTKETALNIYI